MRDYPACSVPPSPQEAEEDDKWDSESEATGSPHPEVLIPPDQAEVPGPEVSVDEPDQTLPDSDTCNVLEANQVQVIDLFTCTGSETIFSL